MWHRLGFGLLIAYNEVLAQQGHKNRVAELRIATDEALGDGSP